MPQSNFLAGVQKKKKKIEDMLCRVARQPLPYPAEPSFCCCSSFSSLPSIELLNDFIKSADAELI